MARARVAYFDRWVHPAGGERLADSERIETVRVDLAQGEAEIASALARAHGMQALIRTDATNSGTGERWLANARLIADCPELLAVCSAGAGYDVIDVAACTARGIIVCNQSGAGREAVAEHALGFMLALSKKISLADRVIRRSRDWNRAAFTGNDLYGKTLGVIGFGQIGSRLAQLCGPFAMTVLACDPFLDSGQCAARGATKVELRELLAAADFVSLNSPLTSASAGMFGAAEFAAMKPGAFFITTARGGVHDEAALVAALASGHLGGAGIDVFAQEPPPPDHPLFTFDNVVATPHSAGITEETTRDIAIATADQWETIFAGGAPPRLINPEAWPAYSARFERAFGVQPQPLA
jgi:D-3-phosphoglycerate dehydrogenase